MNQHLMSLALVFAISMRWGFAELPSEGTMLKEGGDDAQVIINKARTILMTQQVFASPKVGYGGQATAGCWALSVLVRHDKDAIKSFEEIFRGHYEPAAKMYALAGILLVDPQRKTDFTPEKLGKVADLKVDRLDGCDGDTVTCGSLVAQLLKNGASKYVYEKLPSLYLTTDCEKFRRH